MSCSGGLYCEPHTKKIDGITENFDHQNAEISIGDGTGPGKKA